MFNFAENTIDMTAAEILNYYRNLYYAEPQVTERGIVANAINDYFKEVAPRAEVEYWKEQCFHACMNNGCLDKAIVDAAVAREIFEEIESQILERKRKARAERARFYLRRSSQAYDERMLQILNSRVNAWIELGRFIAELKKKYAEGQK